jgi:hypothetical protein
MNLFFRVLLAVHRRSPLPDSYYKIYASFTSNKMISLVDDAYHSLYLRSMCAYLVPEDED